MTFMASLKEHVCICASFEKSANAEVCRGNGEAKLNADVVRYDTEAGRFGGALVFSAKDHGWDEDECTFAARDDFPYREDGGSFAGTVSLWLKGDPDAA